MAAKHGTASEKMQIKEITKEENLLKTLLQLTLVQKRKIDLLSLLTVQLRRRREQPIELKPRLQYGLIQIRYGLAKQNGIIPVENANFGVDTTALI